MVIEQQLENLSAQQLRELTTELMAQITQREQAIASKDRELHYRQSKIDKLTHEIAVLKRNKFGKSSEQLGSEQASLLDEAIDADLAAGFLKVSLEELMMALRDDRHLLHDPQGLFTQRVGGSGAVPGTLYSQGFSAARLVDVVESQAVWVGV